MNTHTIDPRTIWALLAMEAGLILPLISLPAQGDRLPGLVGPMLLMALLPAGYVAVRGITGLRDPSWRLLTGIGLVLLTRAIVSSVAEPGIPGVAVWLAHSVMSLAIGIGLWWRGGALAVAEYTAAEVRTEFGVLAVCLIAALALVRPFLLPDPVLLGASVGLFALGGLVAMAMSRQDAAEVVELPYDRTLAVGSAALPILTAVVLVGILRPALLSTLWLTLAHVLELILTPVGLLVAWIISLFPSGSGASNPPPALPRPTQEPAPDPATLSALQDQMSWIGWVVLFTLLIVVTVAALLVVRILLSNVISAPASRSAITRGGLTIERSGTPGRDAHDLWGWLKRWPGWSLGTRSRGARDESSRPQPQEPVSAWTAYQNLLDWAARQGFPRRAAETTGQLQARLREHDPDAANAVDLVTTTYEYQRYGNVHPPDDRLQHLRDAARTFIER